MSTFRSRSYDDDFFAWTQDQAAALRTVPPAAVGSHVDLANIANEIEDLGRSELRDVNSSLRQVLTHLLKLAALPESRDRAHWFAEVEEFQARAAETYKPSMSALIDLSRAWRLAQRSAAIVVAEMGGVPADAAETCPFGLEELVAADFDVRAAIERIARNPAPRP
jgi:hypothetical protein